MKKIAAALLATFTLVCAPVFAAAPIDPAATRAVISLLDSMHYRELTLRIFNEMSTNLPALIEAEAISQLDLTRNLSAADKAKELASIKAKSREIAAKLIVMLTDPVLIDEIVTEIIPLYASRFTVAEIEQLAAFYKTPLGLKTLQVLPHISAEAMKIADKVTGPRIQKLFEAEK